MHSPQNQYLGPILPALFHLFALAQPALPYRPDHQVPPRDDFANIIVFLGTKGEHTVSVLLRDEPFLNLYRLGRTLLNYKYGFPKLWYLGFILHSLSRTKKEIFVCMSTVAHSTSCFSVTTAVAVLATAANLYQISLLFFLSSLQSK